MHPHSLFVWSGLAVLMWWYWAVPHPTPLIASSCDVSVDAGPDTSLCPPGGTYTLSGTISGNAVAWMWTPTSGLSDPNSLNPIATVNGAVTYTLTAFAHDTSASNLVVNGDFSAGNTGFLTDYNYVADQPGSQTEMFPEGTYTVINNPNLVHTGFSACGDHTGGGNMMVINGAASFQNIWCQTVSVSPNGYYDFSAWVASVNPSSPAQLQFSINGQPIGDIHNATSTLCLWQPFNAVWSSGQATTAQICIVNLNTQPSGNDFALDDISFIALCSASDEVMIDLIQEEAPVPDIDGLANLCTDDIAGYQAMVPDTPQVLSYNWIVDNGQILSGQGTDSVLVQWDGSGEVCVEVETLCDVNQNCFQVAIEELPDYPVIDGPSFLCPGDTVLFLSIPADNVDSMHWILPEGLVLVEGQGTPTLTVAWQGTTAQDLCLEVLNECGVMTACLPLETEVPEPVTLDTLICDGTTFFVNGTEYGAANLYGEEWMLSQNGCDSLVIVVVNIQAMDTVFSQQYTCTATDTGTVSQIVPGAICDTLKVIRTVLAHTDTTHLFLSSCNPQDTGMTSQSYLNQLGCDSTVITIVHYAASDSTWLSLTTCNATDTGTSVTTWQNTFGCDSIVVTSIALLPSDTTWLAASVCAAGDTGTTIQSMINQWGCDSVVIAIATLAGPDTTLLSVSSCFPQDTGVTTIILTNQAGCDSMIIRETTYTGSDTTYRATSTCVPADTGVTVEVLTNQAGCDSVVVLNTDLLAPEYCSIEADFSLIQPACADDPALLLLTPLAGQLPFQLAWVHQPSGTSGMALIDSFTTDTVPLWLSGAYAIHFLSANGLVLMDSLTAVFPPALEAIAMVTSDFGGYGVSCHGLADGSAILEITSAGTPPLAVQWSHGDSVLHAVGLSAGAYTVRITDARGCVATDSITILAPEPLHVDIDYQDVSCFGDNDGEIRVSGIAGGVPPYTVAVDGLLLDGPMAGDLAPGAYEVVVRDRNACDTTIQVEIAEPPDLWIDLPSDTTIFAGTSLSLPVDAFAISAQPTVIWTPPVCDGCLEVEVTPHETTLYAVQLLNPYGCDVRDSILVTVIRDVRYFIPNVFSPNGDGVNDEFFIAAGPGITEVVRLTVFDRWGEIVFQTDRTPPGIPEHGWNGTIDGRALLPGVYIYTAMLQTRTGEMLRVHGDLTLVR
ncbi:MAG: gliding motility-associated C-terminal domain-containing protein [Saprospiraceae bacterium]|nr:gliding motility-associated C-terminal domain-containing protein [Saprospiraceae bacterium]